ncbi:hypothetical protein GUITHDRAFT_162534 [Guillardia theta CCMP2712]|uniref:RING-type E3 ubiquitin transferase n=1 Tax=Guillardia theta (strain CCMP2712) TaxID=905079 RepID=L1JIG9_GUITC|nr:hypothetical protein GUITHDRAFT_162534 [Guillardia theta CCMP2712]EKX48127.1 hypothetical protein GUITHDRAFT_162534 [Guillardia theta CCMP2712]|eukprot:XP_005835107.1 hypothetical protein GUITHDRAFT_162534 [Guillardia theta CCMP2712]
MQVMEGEIAWERASLKSEFKPLKDCLKCQLCKDLLKTPMILGCSHNFCSLCIRRSLQHHNFCPICREPCVEGDLRKNALLGQVVQMYSSLRSTVLKKHQNGQMKSHGQVKVMNQDAAVVAKHISGKYNYNLMSETALKKLCKDTGIPESLIKGDKKHLEKLHKALLRESEFCIRFNAECDRGISKTEDDLRAQIIRELAQEQNAQNRTKANFFDRSTKGEVQGGRTFEDLIRQVRERQKNKKISSSDSPASRHEESPAREQPVGSRGETPCLEVFPEDGEGRRGTLSDAPAQVSIPRPDEVPPPWICLYSRRARRPFFYNPLTRIGTFLWPVGSEEGQRASERGGEEEDGLCAGEAGCTSRLVVEEGGGGGERNKRNADEMDMTNEASAVGWDSNKKKRRGRGDIRF